MVSPFEGVRLLSIVKQITHLLRLILISNSFILLNRLYAFHWRNENIADTGQTSLIYGFLVHKDVVGAVLGCQPVSSRLISIRLRAAPFNITIIQVYAPTSGHDDSEVDHFYQQLQETID